MAMIKCRVEDGRGKEIGQVEIPEEDYARRSTRLEWSKDIWYTTKTHGVHSYFMDAPIYKNSQYGPTIRLKYAQRKRLEGTDVLRRYQAK